jgi:hypothetical protein
MKKILIPAVVLLVLQGSYILKLRDDLSIRKMINEEIIIQVLDRKFEYANNIDNQIEYQDNKPLDEPDCFNNNSNVIERIEMLEMHLDYNPSKKWIKDVLSSAKIKLGA